MRVSLCAVYLPDLHKPENEPELRRVIRKYRNHPALAYWKGPDEPEWARYRSRFG